MSTIARATIKSYDATTHSATVQIAGSLAVWLDAVPVSDGIAPADVVAGRECGVIFFSEDNPADAAIVTIHNAVPTGWPGTAARYSTVQDEGTPLAQRSTLNFAGAGVTATDSAVSRWSRFRGLRRVRRPATSSARIPVRRPRGCMTPATPRG